MRVVSCRWFGALPIFPTPRQHIVPEPYGNTHAGRGIDGPMTLPLRSNGLQLPPAGIFLAIGALTAVFIAIM